MDLKMTHEQLLTTAHVMTWDVFTPSMIRQMQSTPDGAELLRLIVKNEMEASEKIKDALHATL